MIVYVSQIITITIRLVPLIISNSINYIIIHYHSYPLVEEKNPKVRVYSKEYTEEKVK